MSMTRKDFVELADILATHRETLESGENPNVAFGRLMSQMRSFCRTQNINFDSERFERAVYKDTFVER